jgi:hypothetical protein
MGTVANSVTYAYRCQRGFMRKELTSSRLAHRTGALTPQITSSVFAQTITSCLMSGQ